MKIDWITDPHLDHLRSEDHLLDFVKELYARDSDALFITGDIAESKSIYDFLGILSGAYQRPIYFVLGNHDYYGAWMEQTHKRVRDVCSAVPKGILNWMPDCGVTFLERRVAVVGHDGLYDACEGRPGVVMSMMDLYLPKGIYDLADSLNRSARHLFDKLEELAVECSTHVRESVEEAVSQGARKVIVLTHVPPFLEASYFRGKPSDERSRPWYVNKTLGDTLSELAEAHPRVELVCLAGHTHGKRDVQIRDNLRVRVGKARYGCSPQFTSLDLSDV